jgi:hypothetical protein
MSTVSKWVMAIIIVALVMNLLRKPAGTVGIIMASTGGATDFFKALSGQGDTNTAGQKGSFTMGANKVTLG